MTNHQALLDWFQFLGSLAFTLALVPQFVRTLRRKRAEDVDVSFLVLVLLASVFSLVYTVPTRLYFFSGSFVANLIAWGTVLYYRLRPGRRLAPPAPRT